MMCSNLNFLLIFPSFSSPGPQKSGEFLSLPMPLSDQRKLNTKFSLFYSLEGSLTLSHSDRTLLVVSDVNDDNDRKNTHNTETFFSFRERMRGSSSLSNFAARIEASDESLFSLRSKKCTSKGST